MSKKERVQLAIKAAAKFDHAKAARKAWRLHKATFLKAVEKMIATKKRLALAAA